MGTTKTVLAFLAALAVCPQHSLTQRNIDPTIQQKIDDYVQNVFLPTAQISGMGLSIVQNDGEILYSTGYGLADKEKGIKNGNATQFLIGSTSKSFTALLAAKLLHEAFPDLGEAVLDTPIRKLFPDVNFTLIDRFRSEHATFRDLLAHRLCLFRADVLLLANPLNSTEETIYRTRYMEDVCSIRTQFQYNNQMYVFAGELAGVLANKSYADALQDLFDDLGMRDTALVKQTDDFSQMPFRAMPYYVMDNESHPINPDLIKRVNLSNAAGGIYATPDDMTRYMRLHLNLGNLDGRQIVPKEVLEWMYKPSHVSPLLTFKKSKDDKILNMLGYGLGLFLFSYDGWEYIQHGGYFPPYSTLMSLFPAKNLAIFTSTNMGPVLVASEVLHTSIFEILNGNENVAIKSAELAKQLQAEKEEEVDKVRKEFDEIYREKVEKVLKTPELYKKADIVGQYGSGSLGDVDVSERFNEASNQTEYYLDYGQWYKGWLQEEVPNVIYKINWDTDIIQDEYASGGRDSRSYVAFDNGTLVIFQSAGGVSSILGTFELGVRLDLLPPIPWAPDSCGPE